MLVAGDIFDTPNPSGESQKLFYQSLAKIRQALPQLQIIIIAGNHDSAQRLEAPEAIFDAFNIKLIGTLKRQADLPGLQLAQNENGESSAVQAVRKLYQNICDSAEEIAQAIAIKPASPKNKLP